MFSGEISGVFQVGEYGFVNTHQASFRCFAQIGNEAGIQFAVAAKRVYEAAKAKGIGRELPDEFFMTKRGGQAWSP